MSQIESIDWFWNHGKSFTKIIYDDGRIEPRQNHEPPPTQAAHDIAHFICAFHKDLEWDYISYPPHIAEFNAVFVEYLLGSFSHHYYLNLDIDLNEAYDVISSKMKWFTYEHYKIHIDHPSKKNTHFAVIWEQVIQCFDQRFFFFCVLYFDFVFRMYFERV